MGARLKPQNAHIPWIASFEFPCHADAKAFAEMVEEQFGDKALVRKKNVTFNQGAFANWRGTSAVRKALSGRSFTIEMIAEVLANSGYAGTRAGAMAWIGRANIEGVIVRLERGVYEFAPLPTGAVAVATPDHNTQFLPDPQCLACQPEPLQCQPA